MPFFDEPQLRAMVAEFGLLGPFAVIVLLALAIVVSPIPSGPIALVAGALYGPITGTLIVVTGAQSGAIIAFMLARHLYRPAIATTSNRFVVYLLKPHPPHILMAIIFASRLVPFISFDAVSYAAGLSSISFVRFCLATALGIVPASFGLVYLGDHMTSFSSGSFVWVLLAVCMITLVPMVCIWIWQRLHRQ